MDPAAMIFTVVGTMVRSVTSMTSKEVTLQPGVLRDLAFIADELKILPDLLAAAKEEKGDGNRLLGVWLKQFHAVSYEFEDYLENFLVQRDGKSRWRTTTLLPDKRHVAKRVKVLRMKVEVLSLNLRCGTASGSNSKPDASPNAAALSYVAYDEYVLVHDDCQVTHADDGIPLEEYTKIKQILVEYNKDSVEDGVPVLPGETDALMVYQIASEQGKKIIRTILKSLRANERSSLCFTHFTESNILVSSSGKVKFRNVSVLRNLPEGDLLQHQRDNYSSAHKIIEGLFSGNPPQGIQHLLDLIKDDFGARELFHVHGSLAPIAVYSTLFQYMHGHIRWALPKEDMRAILDSLPYVDTWKTQIESNELLLIPFNYNPKSYQLPSDRPKQPCLSKDQMAALQRLGLTPQPRQRSLTRAEIKWIEAFQFFEYLRNRTAHRMDPLKKWIEPNQAANAQGSELFIANLAYNAQGSELVTYIRFPLIVPYMQVELYNRKEHLKIRMDELF